MKNFSIAKLPIGTDKLTQSSSGLQIVQGFMEIARARQDFLQHKETEITKRIQIQKNAEVEISEIREKAQLLRDYFVMSFTERRENFDRCLQLLNDGLDSGNNKKIDAAISLIVSLIKESPLKQAAEVMQQIKNRTGNEIIDI